MGNNWSVSEAWQQLVTKDEVLGAVRSFEAWEKAQGEIQASSLVQRSAPSTGTLLERVGGSDMVRRVVVAYCRRLYADEELAVFLQSTDTITLRAKQSTFMTWLFSPTDQPPASRHLRTAHLRLIKQHGFLPEHFERGLVHMEAAMRELGLSEALVKEAMAKVRPYKDITFTPLPRDADDEQRWAAESRTQQQRQQRQQQPQQQTPVGGPAGLPDRPPAAAAAAADPYAAAAAAAAAGPSAPGFSGSGSPLPSLRSGVPQCPFTGARLSRPPVTAAELPLSVLAAARAAGMRPPPSPRLAPDSASSTAPGTPTAAASVSRLQPLAMPPLPPLPLPPPLPLGRSSYQSSGVTTPKSAAAIGGGGGGGSRQRSTASSYTEEEAATLQSSYTGEAAATLQSALSEPESPHVSSRTSPNSMTRGVPAPSSGWGPAAPLGGAPGWGDVAPPASPAGLRPGVAAVGRTCQGDLWRQGEGGGGGGGGVGSPGPGVGSPLVS